MRDPQRTALRRDEPGYRPRAVYHENTVRTHLYNVFRKLSVKKSHPGAVSWANEHLRH